MKISDLISGVRELWAFIWPPVVLLVIVVGMAKYLAPQSVISVLTPGWKGLLSVADTARPHLEALGLSALVPLVGLFVVVFVLYALRSIVFFVGQLIPPGIAFRPDVLIVRHFEDSELSILWTKYGRSGSLYGIAHSAQPKEDKEDIEGVLVHWERRSRSLGERINTAKFLALWAITLFVVESIIAGHTVTLSMRLALILSLWFLSAVVLLALFLYSVDQQATSAVFVLRQFTLPTLKQEDDLRKLSAADLEYAKSLRGASWWNFEVSGWRSLRWAYLNILRR